MAAPEIVIVPDPPPASGCQECGAETCYEDSTECPALPAKTFPNGYVAEAMPPYRYHRYCCLANPEHRQTLVSDWLVDGRWQERWREHPSGHGEASGVDGHWMPAQVV